MCKSSANNEIEQKAAASACLGRNQGRRVSTTCHARQAEPPRETANGFEVFHRKGLSEELPSRYIPSTSHVED